MINSPNDLKNRCENHKRKLESDSKNYIYDKQNELKQYIQHESNRDSELERIRVF